MSFQVKKIAKANQSYNNTLTNNSKAGIDPMFKVEEGMKSSFDMFGYIFTEIATLRMEVSRAATIVRLNTPASPSMLIPYHAHIKSLWLPISTIVPDNLRNKVDKRWDDTLLEIENFLQRRKVVNLKIPNELIKKLDNQYRICLLAAQKAGLGIRVEADVDINKAIESLIVGN